LFDFLREKKSNKASDQLVKIQQSKRSTPKKANKVSDQLVKNQTKQAINS
jgi:hypothetical protein